VIRQDAAGSVADRNRRYLGEDAVGGACRRSYQRRAAPGRSRSAKRLNHPIAGQMTFTYETMELAANQGLYLIV
jgi:MmyB-like transcription regulator ligand binding domain